MVTNAKSGQDVIRNIRSGCAGKGMNLADTAKVGRFASFCKQARVETTNPNQLDIVCVATTDDLDLDGEVVLPDGADWSYFEKNRVVFLDHSYGSSQAVATLRNIKRQGNGWVCRATLLNDPQNENVRIVKTLAEAGVLGMSIGFTVTDAGQPTPMEQKAYPGADYIIRKWNAVEVSYTAMPCNVACRTQAMIYGGDEKRASVVGLLTKSKTPAALMESMGLVKPRRVVVCG